MSKPLDPGFGSAGGQPSRPAGQHTTLRTSSSTFARVRPLVIPMRRGRLPASFCGHVGHARVDRLERLSGRNASPSGNTPSNILSPARNHPGSWAEVRLGARAQRRWTKRAHGPPGAATTQGWHLTPHGGTSKKRHKWRQRSGNVNGATGARMPAARASFSELSEAGEYRGLIQLTSEGSCSVVDRTLPELTRARASGHDGASMVRSAVGSGGLRSMTDVLTSSVAAPRRLPRVLGTPR